MTWGGLGSRGGHVIGTTRSGKPVYQRGGGTRGWSEMDHHDAAGVHDAAGNAATAQTHRTAARAIREKRRHGGILRRVGAALHSLGDTGTLQTDLLSSRTLLFGRGKLRKGASFMAPGPARGEHVLGKTKSGKPVFASGAKGGGYSDEDHADAATLHARAAAYHEKHAADHGKMRDTDRDWKRSETHNGEHDRHAALRDHHFERVQDHLVAAGRAEEAEFDGNQILNRRPVDKKRRAKTKDELRRRTHHDHPGGHDEADMAEYESYAKPPKKRVAT